MDTTTLDGLGRVTSQTVRGVTTNTTYNSLGEVATVSIAGSGAEDTFQYDALGRVTTITQADGNKVTISYPGNYKATKDEAKNTNTVCFDGLGRVTKVTDALNNETDYTYDVLNDLTGVTEGSQTRTFRYDGLGRLLSATTPESGTTTYSYTTSGGALCSGDPSNPCSRTDARGIAATYTYDALNRLTQKSYSDGTPTANYAYGQGSVTIGNWTSPGLANPLGRLTEATTTTSGGIQTAAIYGYDPMGRVTGFLQCTPYNSPHNCGSGDYEVVFGYDSAGDLDYFKDMIGSAINYTINADQRVTQATSSWIDGGHPQYLVKNITYTPWGAVSQLENGCASSSGQETGCTDALETYTYNNRLQPVMIQLGNTSNASANYCRVYNYYSSVSSFSSCQAPTQGTGDDGDLMGVYDQDNSNSGLSHTAAYTYDGVNRLSAAVATGNSTYNLSFGYDQYGNMTCVQDASTQGPCPVYSFNSSDNQLTNSGYTYDADGNLTGDGTYTYQYDANGHMVTMLQGSSTYATATYNALGWMVNWALPGSGTSQDLGYLPNGQVEGIFNGNGGSVWWYEQYLWLGNRLLAYYDPNYDTYFIHRGANGSFSEITDQGGGLAGDMLFYPFGQEWQYDNGVNAPWWQFYNSFSRWSADLGFDITPHRKYSPTLGRWMTPDPSGRGVVSLNNPQTWNLYAYVTDNPMTLNDPSGLSSKGCPPQFSVAETPCSQVPKVHGAQEQNGCRKGAECITVVGHTSSAPNRPYDPPIITTRDPFSFVLITFFTGGADELFDLGADAVEIEGTAGEGAAAVEESGAEAAGSGDLTVHAEESEMVPRHGITPDQARAVIEEAKKSGNVVEAMGRYGPQLRYTANGIRVVVATTGRNAGKIITAFSLEEGAQ